MKDIDEYFSTGEFARICGVSKHTLLHYDEIDLLKPVFRDKENNYRYYSIDSFEKFFTIKSLQSTGLTLENIRDYISQRNPDKFVQLLDQQVHAIEKQIGELRLVKSVLEEKIEFTSQDIRLNSVRLENLPETPAIITFQEKELSFPSKAFTREIMRHILSCKKLGLDGVFSTGTCYRKEKILSNKYYLSNAFFTRLPREFSHMATNTIPAGSYATIYNRGSVSPGDETYQHLKDYIYRNNLSFAGDFLEDSVLDESSVEGYENYIFKISVAVKKSN